MMRRGTTWAGPPARGMVNRAWPALSHVLASRASRSADASGVRSVRRSDEMMATIAHGCADVTRGERVACGGAGWQLVNGAKGSLRIPAHGSTYNANFKQIARDRSRKCHSVSGLFLCADTLKALIFSVLRHCCTRPYDKS